MAWSIDHLSQAELLSWIEASIASGSNRIGSGYQSDTFLFDDGHRKLVVKAPGGRIPYRWISTWLIRREARAYDHLAGIDAVPRFHGLLNRRYLVLEFVAGEPARYAPITDREYFFSELLAVIRSIHSRGVAHGDLQKKDNLWIREGRPVLLDFGASVIRRSGFAPFNRWMFGLAAQLDLNQWAKLKTGGRPDRLPESERNLYRRTWPEKLASALKYPFRRIRVKHRP